VRVHHKPFVNLIWIGCVLMALGGVLAAADKRYRMKRKAAAAAEVAEVAIPVSAPADPAMRPVAAR
jgi:cytochrome c-type biogenesis protein CcmF